MDIFALGQFYRPAETRPTLSSPLTRPPLSLVIFFLRSSLPPDDLPFSSARRNNRSGMEGSSQSAARSGSAALAWMRDADGFLPLVQCPYCGTRLVGRVSQQPRSFGKRFYKCPKLEHTPLACKFYKMEEHYVEYLATYGVQEGVAANVRGPDLIVRELVEETNESLKAAKDVVQQCNVQMQSAACALKDAEGALKSSDERQMVIGAKIERIGERLFIVGLANIFLVVLVLIVLLVK